MNLFERLFGADSTNTEPKISFGRYSDCYRTPAQEEAFDIAVQEFKKGNHEKAYVAFFNYLLDENEQNVRVWKDNGVLNFELFQGSKKVTGYASAQKLYAEAKVARVKTLNSEFMRRLLEENFTLRYSRFALAPSNEITIVFDTFTSDSSPYKLYGALKELAVNADKNDDLLVDEFDTLEVADFHIRRALPEAEKEIKYQYILQEINSVFEVIDHGPLDKDQYAVAVTYLLLYLCYKLDYLIRPEGYTMETLERIHKLAFGQAGNNAAEKNHLIREEFQKLSGRPKAKFFREMYEVSATFGITGPVDHSKVAIIIEQELPLMKWYKEMGYDQYALAVPGFIVCRSLFNFAIPEPDKDYFHLLIQIMEAGYFARLGFQSFVENGKLDEKAIRKAIREITAKHKKSYGQLNPSLKMLVFNSLPAFAESYLWMVRELDLTLTA